MRGPDARLHESGACPVVELPVGDPRCGAGGGPAVADICGQRGYRGLEQQALLPRLSSGLLHRLGHGGDVGRWSGACGVLRIARQGHLRARGEGGSSHAGNDRGGIHRFVTLELSSDHVNDLGGSTRRYKLSSATRELRAGGQRPLPPSASKSSGEIWSRNSRNRSTSSSCSSGIGIPASPSPSSAPKIGDPVRSARAMASDGRALTSTSPVSTSTAKY